MKDQTAEILVLLFQKLALDAHQEKILVWVHQVHQKLCKRGWIVLVIKLQFYQGAAPILALDITKGIGFRYFQMGLIKNVRLLSMQMVVSLVMEHQ